MFNITPALTKIARGLLVAALILIYTLLVHYVNSTTVAGMHQATSLGAVLALIPLFLIVLTFALKINPRLAGAGLLLLFFAIAWLLWPFLQQHSSLVFWLMDVGLMLALMLTFAQTLTKGRKPLCVHFAEIINGGTLPPDHEMYARNVTVAWVLFFAMIILVSTLLFFTAPLTVWSFFVNFVTLPLVALMFIAEFLVRKRLLTNLPEGNVMDAVRAYMDKSNLDKSTLDKSAL